jgi:hypothetical protein
MLHRRFHVLLAFTILPALVIPALAQTVISARSGVIHFFEGKVYLNDEPLESRFGKFPTVAPGAELRTEQGYAEVLLTPGVFLRLGEKSAVRMIGNDLTDTRLELMAGSAIVDSVEPGSGTSVTLIFRDWKIHPLEKGAYRLDSEPPRLWVDEGKAQVSRVTDAGADAAVSVSQGKVLPFAAVLVPDEANDEPADKLSEWSAGRGESIAADNAIAAQISDDPSTIENNLALGPDVFTYFPLLGVTPRYPDLSGQYGSSFTTYQPGFNSIYLPGYAYRPYILGVPIIGFRHSPYPYTGIGVYPYRRPGIGVVPGIGIPLRGGTRIPGLTLPPAPIPMAPRPPVPHGGGLPHGGGRGGHR